MLEFTLIQTGLSVAIATHTIIAVAETPDGCNIVVKGGEVCKVKDDFRTTLNRIRKDCYDVS